MSAKKHLAYFFLQGEATSLSLLNKTVETLKANTVTNLDIIVLCDEDCSKLIQEGLSPDVHVIVTECNSEPLDAAKRRLQVFDLVPNISEYATVVSLEIGLVFVWDIALMLAECTTTKLYVYNEPGRDFYDWIQYGLKRYTPDEKMSFNFKNIYGFNTRTFMFRPTTEMKEHFAKIVDTLITHYDPSALFLEEQSFMNHYFLTRMAVDLDRRALMKYVYFATPSTKYDARYPLAVSFQIQGMTNEGKLHAMQYYYNASREAQNMPPQLQSSGKVKTVEELMFRLGSSVSAGDTNETPLQNGPV